MAKYIRIDLLEPIDGTHPMAEPDEALRYFMGYLLNEFENQGIAARVSIVDEGEEDEDQDE